MTKYKCRYCPRTFPTEKGRDVHIGRVHTHTIVTRPRTAAPKLSEIAPKRSATAQAAPKRRGRPPKRSPISLSEATAALRVKRDALVESYNTVIEVLEGMLHEK